MGNVNIGSGNISKKIGYSITDEQLEKISAKAVETLGIGGGTGYKEIYSGQIDTTYEPGIYAILFTETEEYDVTRGWLVCSQGITTNNWMDDDGTTHSEHEIHQLLYTDEYEGVLRYRKRRYETWSDWKKIGQDEADNVFVIHATLTSETTATIKGSYDEVKEAITAEKQILIALNGILFTSNYCYWNNDENDEFMRIVYENNYSTYTAKMTPDGTVTFDTTGKVFSVNGKTEAVELTAEDVGAMTKDNVENLINSFSAAMVIPLQQKKADKATTLSGYGIEDAYTKDETNSNISGAVDTNIGILRAEISQELSEELPKKADKTTLFTWGTSGIENFVLDNNQEAMFFADMAVMVLAMPETINDLYHSNFSFSSGEEPTTLTYSATPIIWVGDDCDADGIFVPEANTRYEVNIKRLGDDIVARVGAY